MQSCDADFKGLLSAVVDTTCWDEAKQIAQNNKSRLESQLVELSILAQQCQQNIGQVEADLERQQQQQQQWEEEHQQNQVGVVCVYCCPCKLHLQDRVDSYLRGSSQ